LSLYIQDNELHGFQTYNYVQDPDIQRETLAFGPICFESLDHMRLIHAARLELERFDDDTKIPPYAILSHTWGDDEVSLQQFQDAYIGDQHTRNRVQKMLGYAKIGKACKQATKEGYKYVWVDTCKSCFRVSMF
jgi:hypothetical protein